MPIWRAGPLAGRWSRLNRWAGSPGDRKVARHGNRPGRLAAHAGRGRDVDRLALAQCPSGELQSGDGGAPVGVADLLVERDPYAAETLDRDHEAAVRRGAGLDGMPREPYVDQAG